MPHWWTLCIEAYPIRRLLSPPPTPLSLLRRSSRPLPLPSPPPSRLPLPRPGACLGTSSSIATPCFGPSLTRSSPPSRFFSSTSSQTYSFAPSAAMQSVRISSAGDIADALMEALLCFGAASCSIEDTNLGAPQEQEIHSDGPIPWQSGKRQLWKESTITALFAAGDDVGEVLAMAANSVGLKEMPLYEVEELEDCDWVLEVESQFKPVEVSQGLWIVPKWSQPPDAKALNVIIDPGLAFGTGEHPTTRLCLQWLHHVVSPGDKILDYGTGSGILCIAALKMGAAHAIGVDIDPVAISSAEYNASLDNLKPNTWQVYVAPADGDDPVPKESTDFDVVAANILLNPLVELAGRITGYCKVGGLVGVSGILVEQRRSLPAHERNLDQRENLLLLVLLLERQTAFQQSALGVRRGRFLRAVRRWKSLVTRLRCKRSTSSNVLGLRSTPALQVAQRMANRQDFERLRQQSRCSPFFGDYSHNLTLRERINGGTYGEIRAATWRCEEGCEYDAVVKILNGRQGLSQGMLDRMAELRYDSFGFHNSCLIFRATLLRDGRLALVMRRYSGSLQELIDLKMQGKVHNQGPPFSDHEAKHLILEVAKGMNILHINGILHGDLKPSNALILEPADGGPIRCYVADFECSGDVGTGFFRSPEVLQGLRRVGSAGVVRSYEKHSDVYSFGMSCFEICTGLVPLENEVTMSNYDSILEGHRPALPGYIDPRVQELIRRCWDAEPSVRPTFGMIVDELDRMITEVPVICEPQPSL